MLVDPTLLDLDQLQLVSFIQSFGIPVDSMTKLVTPRPSTAQSSLGMTSYLKLSRLLEARTARSPVVVVVKCMAQQTPPTSKEPSKKYIVEP